MRARICLHIKAKTWSIKLPFQIKFQRNLRKIFRWSFIYIFLIFVRPFLSLLGLFCDICSKRKYCIFKWSLDVIFDFGFSIPERCFFYEIRPYFICRIRGQRFVIMVNFILIAELYADNLKFRFWTVKYIL